MCQNCHTTECEVIEVPIDLVETIQREIYKNVPKELRIHCQTKRIRSDLKVVTEEEKVFKECTKCGKLKPADTINFRMLRGKLHSQCRECEQIEDNNRRNSKEYVAIDSKQHRKYQLKIDNKHGTNTIKLRKCNKYFKGLSYFGCVVCGYLWSATLSNVTSSKKTGCPNCAGNIPIKTKEEAQAKVDEAHGKDKIIVEEYAGNVRSKSLFICVKCKQLWSSTLDSVTNGKKTGCPHCKQWKHMKKVGKLIEKLLPKGFTLKSEHTFNELRHRGLLKIDFAILDSENNVVGLIEVNGKQHYEYVPHFHRNGVSDYLDQVERDNKKAVFAVENNYPLLVVPYWVRKSADINALASPFVTRTTQQSKKQELYPIKERMNGQLTFCI